MARKHTDTQEFSRFVEAAKLGQLPVDRDIAATPEECRALAERLGLLAIARLEAHFTLWRIRSQLIRADARLIAQVTQECVVTLVPLEAAIDETFSVLLTENEEPDEDSGDTEVDMDADDPPEPIRHGRIDMGELAAEQLALALDPYPRAPGAMLPTEFAPEPEVPAAGKAQAEPQGDRIRPFKDLDKLVR